jgi:drug/metabolite transporter (DMT)-like permease
VRAFAVLALSVVCIAWSAPLVRWADVPGVTSAFYRALVAAVVLVPYWLLSRRGNLPSARATLIALLGGAFFAMDLAFFNTAVLKTSATTAMVLTNNSPVLVGLGTWLLFRERPKLTFWIGLMLALGGCIVMVGGDMIRPGSGGVGIGDVGGDMLAAAASVFFAAYLITTGRVRASMDTITFTTLAIIGSVATMWVVCLLMKAPLVGFKASAWPSLIALGLVTQVTGYLGVTYALGRLPTTAASVGLLGVAPVTALLDVVFLGEPLQLAQIIGGTLVLAGIFVVNRRTAGNTLTKRNEAALDSYVPDAPVTRERLSVELERL